MPKRFTGIKKYIFSASLSFLLIFQVCAIGIFAPEETQAVGLPVVVTGDVPRTADQIKEVIQNTLTATALGSIMNAVSYFTKKIAYDTANYIASGGKGQGALVFKDGFAKYMKDVGEGTAGTLIESIGAPFGINFCKPPSVQLQVFLQVGLRGLYTEPQPNCTWTQIANSWTGEKLAAAGRDVVSQAFANSLRPTNNDFGLALGYAAKIDRFTDQKIKGAQNDRAEGGGFKPVTDLISGKIKTPADVVKQESKNVSVNEQQRTSVQQIAGIYGSGMYAVLPQAASIFLNTLTSKLLDNVLKGGLFSGDDADSGAAGVLNPYASGVARDRSAIEKAFSYLIAKVPTQQNDFDVVETYASCPNNGLYADVNNCVLDENLKNILVQGRNPEQAVTIREALEKNLLNPNARLISPYRPVDNENKTACISGNQYCYSNIQKLRKVRILPTGFELAALKSDPDKPWILGDVVKGFEDCKREEGSNNIIPDDAGHPYCHLIDPNWILKAPPAQCQAMVNGPVLLSADGSERREECADISTCLAKDTNGNCIDYGFCTKEKNEWQLPGQSCQEQFATCRTVINTRNNQVNSYLTRTVDFGECSQKSVGCRAYATEQKNGAWIPSSEPVDITKKALGRPGTLYFNETINNNVCPVPAGSENQAEGCSAFWTSPTSTDPLTALPLRKAPDYLGCYDTNLATPAIDWPQSEAELTALENRPASCSNFAAACAPEEVGCRAYQPADARLQKLTAVVGANSCAAECVGYETFKQEAPASGLDSSKFPLYFIPSDATQCSAVNEGCTEFTNIDSKNNGGENREYYTTIKYCEKPSGTNEKTYYSYEGKINEGYVLQVHKMRPINNADVAYVASLVSLNQVSADVASSFVLNSPAYADDRADTLAESVASCNETKYKILLSNPNDPNAASPDCTAYYDDAEHIFYRKSANTVSIAADCHPLRRTDSELVTVSLTAESCAYKKGVVVGPNQCQVCAGGGQYTNGACVYSAINRPNESTSCPAAQNGCRAFTGNASNNVQIVKKFTFDPDSFASSTLGGTLDGWSNGVAPKPESLITGQYSLQVNTNDPVIYTFATNTFVTGDTLELNFWARGTQQNVKISLVGTDKNGQTTTDYFTFDPIDQQPAVSGISATWQQYHFAGVVFSGDGTKPVQLRFVRSAVSNIPVGPYYLDNIALSRVQSKLYVLKNSWQQKVTYNGVTTTANVSLACDANPVDSFPGTALGCQQYADINNPDVPVYATGFERLCRDQAAGCQPLYDSQNTLETKNETAYNVWCAAGIANETVTGSTCMLSVGAASKPLGSCEIIVGSTGCFIDAVELPTGFALPVSAIKRSTIQIPKDTPASSPIYLAAQPSVQCAPEYLGCMKVGLEEQLNPGSASSSFSFADKLIKNSVDKYATTLCRQDLLGCSEFQAGNDILYFKDPQITAHKICVYKPEHDDLSHPGQKTSGWFLEGSNDTPCYPNYIDNDKGYGMWSNKTSSTYEGYVGRCDAALNGCTELVDHADTSPIHPNGAPYYAIMDDVLQAKISECKGQASLKDGCVLLDQTENPTKIYNTQATYNESKAHNYAPVSPITTGAKDATIILKVDRDRTCSEWLACKSAMSVVDPNNPAKTRSQCYEYRTCNKMSATGECLNWVDNPNGEEIPRLTAESYVTRSTGWNDVDYTGYSLLNKYQINDFVYVHFTGDTVGYLAHEISADILEKNNAPTCKLEANSSSDTTQGRVCGDGGGRCYNSRCLYPVGGSFPVSLKQDQIAKDPTLLKKYLEPGICKDFPEKTSPFSTDVALAGLPGTPLSNPTMKNDGATRSNYTNKKNDYSNANVCQTNGAAGDCQCEYRKVEYKDGAATDYWPIQQSTGKSAIIPGGVCTAGEITVKDKKVSSVGMPCNSNSDCGAADAGATCSIKEKEGVYYGQRGFCLEYDLSSPLGLIKKADGTVEKKYACSTWLPIQTSASSLDLFNVDESAGYSPAKDAPNGGELYCLAGTRSGRYYDQKAFNFDGLNSQIDSIFGQYFTTEPSKSPYGSKKTAGNIFGSDLIQFYPSITLQDTVGEHAVLYTNCDFNNYAQDACKKEGVGLYKALQTWSWKQFGDNALVLRIEGSSGDYDSGEVSSDIKDFFGVANTSVSSFAPVIGDSLNCHDTGFLMHPPLDWTTTKGDFGYQSNTKECFINRATNLYSPGPAIADSQGTGSQYLYRSPYEASIKESDIDRICFVPLLIAGGYDHNSDSGATSYVPALLSSNYCIKLNADFLETIDEGTVYIDHERGMTYDNDIANNPDVDYDQSTLLFPVDHRENGMYLWTYKDKAGTYPYPVGGQVDEKSVVKSRYVSVVYYKNDDGTSLVSDFPDLVNKKDVGPPQNSSEDPFKRTPLEGKENNWLALGVDFNKDGDFLGYVSRYYHGAFKTSGIRFAVVATLKNQCSSFVKVYNNTNPIGDQTNKAWTNRLWEYAKNDKHPFVDLADTIKRGQELKPYGSLNLKANDFDNNTKLRNYTFYNAALDGVPLSCEGAWQNAPHIDAQSKCSNLTTQNTLYADYPLSLADTIGTLMNSQDRAVAALHHLFAQAYGWKNNTSGGEFSDNPLLYTDTSNIEKIKEFTLDQAEISLSPPQIYSVNPATCSGDPAVTCAAGEKNNITIKDKNYTLANYDHDPYNRADEDKNFDGTPDPIIDIGSFVAVARFFAFADDNRMPIRSVIPDWGDGSALNDKIGLYKNRKPVCGQNDQYDLGSVGRCSTLIAGAKTSLETYADGIDSELTCNLSKNIGDTGENQECDALRTNDSDSKVYCRVLKQRRFGDAERSCKPGYFEFTHTYTCSPSQAKTTVSDLKNISTEAYNRVRALGRADTDKVCVFKPRVQVKDNWGWSNGMCARQFDGNGNLSGSLLPGCYNSLKKPNGGFLDQTSGTNNFLDPWTYYRGSIIVLPKK